MRRETQQDLMTDMVCRTVRVGRRRRNTMWVLRGHNNNVVLRRSESNTMITNAAATAAAAATTLTLVLLMSAVSAFQVTAPTAFVNGPLHRSGSNICPKPDTTTTTTAKTSPISNSFERSSVYRQYRPSVTLDVVAADADTLLLEKVGRRSSFPGGMNEIYEIPMNQRKSNGNKRKTRVVQIDGKNVKRDQLPQNIQFHSISQTDNPKKRRAKLRTSASTGSSTAVKSNKSKALKYSSVNSGAATSSSTGTSSTASSSSKMTKPRRSRSSTMPGFAGESDRQRAYRDGIRLVEERTGKRIVETSEIRRKRRKEQGEAMYRNSASVPDSMVMFAEEIHQEDMISRAEEIELGEKTQEAIKLQGLYNNLESQLGREPTDEEWCAAAGKINMEALGQVIQEGLEAKNKLVTANLRMVQSVVNTYIRNGLSAQYNAGDMMQEGIIALIRAAEKFEPDRGWKFSTYAMYWVRASVKRNQIFQSRIINVPPRVHENHKRLLRVQQELYAVLGRKPTKKELGDAVGMSELQVTRCFTAMKQTCHSLDQGIKNSLKPMSGDSDKDTLVELIDSKTDDGENTNMKRVFLREDLVETLHRHLEPHEVDLLLLRFGLHDTSTQIGRQLPIIELSRIVGWKPDKVRRTINRSLKQLKSAGMDEWNSFERDLQ